MRNRTLNYRPGFRPTFFSQETDTEFIKSALDSAFLSCRRLSLSCVPAASAAPSVRELHRTCFVVDGAAASTCTLLHCIVEFLIEIMQVFVHSEVSVLGASVQLQLRHLPSKLSQRSVHYSRVLAFGERVLNRVNSVSQDAFFKGKKNLRPLCNRAESIMLEDESCASGSVRRSIVAANYDSSPKLARIDDCIDHSDGVTSSSFVADHVTISPFAPLVQPPGIPVHIHLLPG